MAGRARRAAVQALTQVHRAKGYSNIVLDQQIRAQEMEPADQALFSRIFYGVIERRLTLDYVLSECSSVPLHKIHPTVLEILRTGLYQLLFLDKIPPSAAVNEAVNLTKSMGQSKASGFVNGVLRGAIRRQGEILGKLPDTPDGWEIRYSCPRAWIDLWLNSYGEETARRLLEKLNEVPDVALRVNTLQTTPETFGHLLEEAGISYSWVDHLPGCCRVEDGISLKRLAQKAKNWYYHQDTASQWCCLALGAQPGERVADVCAAPGGKSLTVAQYMDNRGEILAGDVYPAKCDAMERRAQELGVSILRTAARDASKPVPEPLRGTFDRVICDVPCSGLGVIRRKPEIRYKDPASVASLPALQYAILEQAAALVRPGGVLQYSTCTLNPAENEEIADRFLQEHPGFSPQILPLAACFTAAGQTPSAKLTLFPHIHGSDGFFIAGFVRPGG